MLYISQPAASQHVRKLERAFGAKLIEMSGRHPTLTPAGIHVYELARRIEEELQATREQVDEILGRSQQLVTITGNSTPLLHRLSPILKDFWAAHPDTSVKTVKASNERITDLVRSGTADIGFQTRGFLHDSLEFRPAWEEYLVAVRARDHRSGVDDRIDARRLASEKLVLTVGPEVRGLIDDWFEARDARPTDVMDVSSFEQVRKATLDGLGIGILPSYVVAGDLAAGTIVCLDVDEFTLSRTRYLIHRSHLRAPAQWLVERLIAGGDLTAS